MTRTENQEKPYRKKAPTGRPTRTISNTVKGTKNVLQPGSHKRAPSSAETSASTPAPQQPVDCQYTIPSAHTEVSCRMRVRKKSTAGAKTSTRNRLAGWRRKKVKLKHTKNNGHSDPKGGNMTSGRRGNHKAPRHPLGSGTVCKWQRACRGQRQPGTTSSAHCDKCEAKAQRWKRGQPTRKQNGQHKAPRHPRGSGTSERQQESMPAGRGNCRS